MTVEELFLRGLMSADPAHGFDVVQEANEGDPPEDRWPVLGARWDEERRELVLQAWE